ncbi:MAG: MerR family transcriptional regulator [Propionicimonas sp.]|uniref:MerR family transcriptional regulator n=1 Tax=Propionicimonas sp. TaxID=1955623 RepID=UPI003D117825
MVTIKRAAELTGVPEHTLRAWERRYGLVSPGRSAAGYRDYDEQALDRIRTMHGLVEEGWAPRKAALEAARRENGAATAQDLVAAASAMDSEAAGRVIDDLFAHGPFEAVVDDWLMPAMVEMGHAWASGTVSVAGEHLVSNLVMRRLAAAYDATAQPASGPTLLVGAPPGVDHQLSLLAFATAARRAGAVTVYLGAQVPAEAWREAAVAVGARAAVSSVHRRRDAARLRAVADEFRGLPAFELWVGGRHQHLAPTPFRPLGHSITAAARLLVDGNTPAAAPQPG